MLKKVSSILLVVVVAVMLVTPLIATAQTPATGLSQDNPGGGLFENILSCDANSGVLCILSRILFFILAIAFIVAVIFLVVGGFRYIVSQGNEEGVEKAKATITNAIIGIVVIVLAWIILTVVLNIVGTGSAGTTV